MFFSVCLCGVVFCLGFKLLLQTGSAELLLTELRLVFHWIMHVGSGLLFPYAGVNLEEAQGCSLGSLDRTPRDTQVCFIIWEFNLDGHETCAAATFAPSGKTHPRNMSPLFTQMF